ncbi:Mss4-like protein [Tricharina praecox]|uniref:Mss4-like protein n=1 Tax=Tricharina praecox TaxID=43433 RepID=UPI002220C8EA|nr:Mss4-like protein [Tricharina praecox]KAI5854404.1 Mss4-like protein [Tricharina praecox]
MRPPSRLFTNFIRTATPVSTKQHQQIRRLTTTATMSADTPHNNDSDTSGLPEAHKRIVHRNRMDRPPYSAAPGGSSPFPTVLTASCFCSTVQYSLSRSSPLDAKFCHCSTCQRLHGAPFQWAAIVHKTDVLFTKGREDLVYYNPGEKSSEYTLPCKVACKRCRTPIMDEGRNMLLLFPTLIRFGGVAEKRKWYPSCHIFYAQRAVDIVDGLPKFEKHKDESDLMPETLKEHDKDGTGREEKAEFSLEHAGYARQASDAGKNDRGGEGGNMVMVLMGYGMVVDTQITPEKKRKELEPYEIRSYYM